MNCRKSLVIVQPYVPEYRSVFFERLISALAKDNVDCKIAASEPDAEQSLRGDAVRPEWLVPIAQKRLSLAGKTIGLGGARSAWKGADGVIVGHLGSSLDTYLAILESRTTRLRVGLWGHIKSYVQQGHPLDLALERWQLRAAHHVFAYTPGGARYALESGVLRENVTTVMNSVDTDALVEAMQNVTTEDIRALASRYSLVPGRTLAFWGGLDGSKRIDFLADVLDQLWVREPDIKVLIGGSGSQDQLLKRSVDRGQSIMLGFVDQNQQAIIAQIAEAILMPGRIGLIAVDALVLKLPIITTDWPYHSAEAEYLVEGESRITSNNDVSSYVAMIQKYLSQSRHLRPAINSYPTIDEMVKNYASGVAHLLDPSGARNGQ